MRFRQFRIAVLLLVFVLAAGSTAYDSYAARGWQGPLQVEIRPIAGDASPRTQAYLQQLGPQDYRDLDNFVSTQAARYGLKLNPALTLTVLPPGQRVPPSPPISANPLAVAAWSLRLRAWSYRERAQWLPRPGVVRLYVVYYAPDTTVRIAHSLGLQKGLLGVVHAWAAADDTRRNQVVIAHELLHTLGASDKYDPATNLPRYPEGYAEPALSPRYPQAYAEIMAGRIARAPDRAVIPPSLQFARIGPQTAREIGFDTAFTRQWAAR